MTRATRPGRVLKPMPANNVPFAAEDASDCGFLLVRSSQQAAQKNFIYDQMSGYLALFGA